MKVDVRIGDRVLFSHSELACPMTGIVGLAPHFDEHLAYLRMAFGHPMRVTSCCRSAKHNRVVGGHPLSLHICNKRRHGMRGTAAIDIDTPDVTYAHALVKLALLHGWSVGVSRNFVHLDRRDFAGLPAGVFGY